MSKNVEVSEVVISVIALCYNHENYVLECLESIRKQTFQKFELIICDDCSVDSSVSIIENWLLTSGLQYNFIKHSSNRGVCKTLNEALKIAKGKYLAMIATDDMWLPEKLHIQLRELDNCPDTVGVLYSDAYQIDKNGFPIEGMFIESHNPLVATPEGNIFDLIATRNFIPAMATLIRMDCYKTVGFYDENLSFEDWDMWLRMALKYKFKYSEYVSAKYRILPTSLARTLLASDNPSKIDTYFRIKIKCIESRKLGVENSKKFKKQIWDHAYQLYLSNEHGTFTRMLKVYRITGRTRALLLGISAALGLTRGKLQTIRSKIIS